MPRALAKGLPMLGNPEAVKKLRAGLRKRARTAKTKISQISITDTEVSFTVDDQATFDTICADLERFPGATVIVADDGLAELLQEYTKPETKPEPKSKR